MKKLIVTLNFVIVLCSVFVVFSNLYKVSAQVKLEYDKKFDPKANRKDGLVMLKIVKEIIEQNYYDPNFRGLDLKERYRLAEERIQSQEHRWQIHRTIAQFLLDLNDSHTIFYPPDRLFRVEYGFSMMIIGNSCFITEVKKGSHAEKQGLEAGSKIDVFNGMVPDRDNLWAINYLIYVLDPQETIKLDVTKPDGKKTEITINAKFLSPAERKTERQMRRKEEASKPYTCKEVNSELIACKLRTFSTEKSEIDKMMKDVSKYKKMILDLRGNGGGYVETKQHLTSYFFDKRVEIGTEINRNKKRVMFSEKRNNAFLGELFVIIDSQSASASEIFARTIQIEKRGKVLGDTSSGAVMTSVQPVIGIEAGTANIDFKAFRNFAVSVTIGDLIMSDGSRLEGIGVTPDHLVGPTPLALFQRNDPVLLFATELAGTPISMEEAAKFNFFVPKSEEESDGEADEKKSK